MTMLKSVPEASRLALFARACGHPLVLEVMADCADCIDTENSAQHDPDVCPYDGSKWIALAAELRQKAAGIRAEDPDIWQDAKPLDSSKPIDMILHCPNCGVQHIDAPSFTQACESCPPPAWTNPPHRSHLCHVCGHVWRPADVPTNGVAKIQTKGKDD